MAIRQNPAHRFQFLDFDEYSDESKNSSTPIQPPNLDSTPNHTPSPTLRAHHTVNTNPSPLLQSRQTSGSPQTNRSRQKRSSLQDNCINGVQDSKLNVFQKLSVHSESNGSEGSATSLHSNGDNGVASSSLMVGKFGRDTVSLTEYKSKRPASFALWIPIVPYNSHFNALAAQLLFTCLVL